MIVSLVLGMLILRILVCVVLMVTHTHPSVSCYKKQLMSMYIMLGDVTLPTVEVAL